jgi:hypothetical protein
MVGRSIDYRGATESELRAAQHKLLYRTPDARFPHKGVMRVEANALMLGGWHEIQRSSIRKIECTFTDVYTRSTASGGETVRLGALFGGAGKPLVLHVFDGEPVYLLLQWSMWSYRNQAVGWEPGLQVWLTQAEPGSAPATERDQVPGSGVPPSGVEDAESVALASQLDLGALSEREVVAVRGFLDRRAGLTADARARVAQELADAVRSHVPGLAAGLPPEAQLEAIAEAAARS